MIRLAALKQMRVRDAAGKALGRVEEVHVDDDARVLMIACGARGWFEKYARHGRPKLVDWDEVERIDGRTIFLRARNEPND